MTSATLTASHMTIRPVRLAETAPGLGLFSLPDTSPEAGPHTDGREACAYLIHLIDRLIDGHIDEAPFRDLASMVLSFLPTPVCASAVDALLTSAATCDDARILTEAVRAVRLDVSYRLLPAS